MINGHNHQKKCTKCIFLYFSRISSQGRKNMNVSDHNLQGLSSTVKTHQEHSGPNWRDLFASYPKHSQNNDFNCFVSIGNETKNCLTISTQHLDGVYPWFLPHFHDRPLGWDPITLKNNNQNSKNLFMLETQRWHENTNMAESEGRTKTDCRRGRLVQIFPNQDSMQPSFHVVLFLLSAQNNFWRDWHFQIPRMIPAKIEKLGLDIAKIEILQLNREQITFPEQEHCQDRALDFHWWPTSISTPDPRSCSLSWPVQQLELCSLGRVLQLDGSLMPTSQHFQQWEAWQLETLHMLSRVHWSGKASERGPMKGKSQNWKYSCSCSWHFYYNFIPQSRTVWSNKRKKIAWESDSFSTGPCNFPNEGFKILLILETASSRDFNFIISQ